MYPPAAYNTTPTHQYGDPALAASRHPMPGNGPHPGVQATNSDMSMGTNLSQEQLHTGMQPRMPGQPSESETFYDANQNLTSNRWGSASAGSNTSEQPREMNQDELLFDTYF